MNESPVTASLRSATPKENTPYYFDFRGVIFSERRKGCFLSGFCLPSIQAVWRGEIQYGRGKAKIIFAGGKGFCFASALYVLERAFPPRRRVREECATEPLHLASNCGMVIIMKKVLVNTPAILEQAHKNGFLCGVILFGSSLYKSEPKDIDLAIITSTGNFDDFVKLLSPDSSLSEYDVSLIKREEIDPDKKFYFGSHGQYLVESLREGITLLGENPFLNFPKTEVFDIKSSIVNRMREYIYVLRKSYFDEQAERKFISRYDKMVLLSAFLLLDVFSYPEIFTINMNDVEVKLKKKGYLLFSDKKRNIEEIWTDINKQY